MSLPPLWILVLLLAIVIGAGLWLSGKFVFFLIVSIMWKTVLYICYTNLILKTCATMMMEYCSTYSFKSVLMVNYI